MKFVIATHGYLAKGLKMSTEFIMGEQANLYALAAYTPDCQNFTEAVSEFIKKYNSEDIIFGTDIAGGSVNNELQKIVALNPRLHLVSGINLPFILQFLTSNQKDISMIISESIAASKEGIINFDKADNESSLSVGEEDFDTF